MKSFNLYKSVPESVLTIKYDQVFRKSNSYARSKVSSFEVSSSKNNDNLTKALCIFSKVQIYTTVIDSPSSYAIIDQLPLSVCQ